MAESACNSIRDDSVKTNKPLPLSEFNQIVLDADPHFQDPQEGSKPPVSNLTLPHLCGPPEGIDGQKVSQGEHQRIKIRPSDQTKEISVNSYTPFIKIPFGIC